MGYNKAIKDDAGKPETAPASSFILRAQVREQLESGEPFSMTFITADRRKGTGGELITVSRWVKVTGEQLLSSNNKMVREQAVKMLKDPDHRKHKTVNIRDLRNPNRVRKIHLRLIIFFNNKRVIQ